MESTKKQRIGVYMKRKIYFVRHAERDTYIKDDYNAPLTEKGQLQSKNLIEILKDKEIEAIYSSPHKRAIDTIIPISKYLNLKLKLLDGLKERKIGEWVKDFSGFCYQQWNDFDYKLQEGESLNDVRVRILYAYHKIMSESSGNIIICGHGTSLSVLLNELTLHKFSYNEFLELNMPDVLVFNTKNNCVESIL